MASGSRRAAVASTENDEKQSDSDRGEAPCIQRDVPGDVFVTLDASRQERRTYLVTRSDSVLDTFELVCE
jgi:hypothetical protein